MTIPWHALTPIITTIATGLLLFYFQRAQKHRDAKMEARAHVRQEESYHTMQMTKATMALCKANSIALRDGKCNGEMTAAMEYCDDADREYTQFVRRQGAAHIHQN